MPPVDVARVADLGDSGRVLARGDDAGERQTLGAPKLVGTERRMEDDVGEEIEARVEILAQELGGDRREIGAGIGAELATEELDLARQLLRAPTRRALIEQVGGELGDAFLARLDRRRRRPAAGDGSA